MMLKLSEETLRKINRLLHPRSGNAHKAPREGGVVGALIAGLLSQNTTDNNRDLGYSRLWGKFGDWEKVARAPKEEIEEAIRPAGMMHQRAPRILALLEAIHERSGGYNADFLLKMPFEDAFSWLNSQDGIGEKTSAVFLLFHRNAPYFPVDTHIRRILTRLGFFPEGSSAIDIQRKMTEITPPELMMDLHLNIIDLGKKICRPRGPKCFECELSALCKFAKNSKKYI